MRNLTNSTKVGTPSTLVSTVVCRRTAVPRNGSVAEGQPAEPCYHTAVSTGCTFKPEHFSTNVSLRPMCVANYKLQARLIVYRAYVVFPMFAIKHHLVGGPYILSFSLSLRDSRYHRCFTIVPEGSMGKRHGRRL